MMFPVTTRCLAFHLPALESTTFAYPATASDSNPDASGIGSAAELTRNSFDYVPSGDDVLRVKIFKILDSRLIRSCSCWSLGTSR